MHHPGGMPDFRYNPYGGPAQAMMFHNSHGFHGGFKGKPRPGFQTGAGSGHGGGGGPPLPVDVQPQGPPLFVYNIGVQCTEYDLYTLFSPYGRVLKVDIIRDFKNSHNAKFAFVTMATKEEASVVIQNLNGYKFTQRPLQVRFHEPKGGQNVAGGANAANFSGPGANNASQGGGAAVQQSYSAVAPP